MANEKPHIRIDKWEDFQHYKDRDPPWIKMYNSLLDDYDYTRLPDSARSHLHGLWLLASRTGNRIPLDVDWIATKLHASTPIDLRPLLNAGFIRLYHHDSEPLAQGASNLQAFARSREAEAETEVEGSDVSSLRSSTSGASADVDNSRDEGKPNRWSGTVDALREHFWQADQPPGERTVGQELSVAKQVCQRWGIAVPDLSDAIEGFATLRDRGFWSGWIEPGETCCALVFNRSVEDEEGIPIARRSLHEARKRNPGRRKPSDPTHVSEVEIGA